MKKVLLFFVCMLLLTGCAAETFETLGQIQHVQQSVPTMASVQLSLPESAVAQTFGSEDMMYDCDGYILLLQTFSSGDLTATAMALSGFSPERLTVIQTGSEGIKRYDWVWTAAGSEGDVLGRAAVLDDGNYHYCLCTIASASLSTDLAEEWGALFGSFVLTQ